MAKPKFKARFGSLRSESRKPALVTSRKARLPFDRSAPAVVKKVELTTLTHRFPMVGIGASAGGLEALEEFFAQMPADTGLGFVVVTHQHPGHPSMLAELLGKRTVLPVVEAGDGMKVEANRVYVAPPGGQFEIRDGRLHRVGAGSKESPHLPIDHFFRSLAADQKEKAICIILSGTGTDGTLGLKAIKDGRVLDVWLTVTKLVDDTGQPVAIATTERDITQNKQQ